ncbi:MAG: hypothetical protein K2J87_06610, partial [Muribaculaceae bacterium]|nr:hypothetical protein [Muribaculaceae bacterium]
LAIHKGDRFTMQSMELGVVLGSISSNPVTLENPTAELATYDNGGQWYGTCDFNAYCDIYFEFEDLKATLTFEKVGEIEFNAAETILSVYNGFSVKPAETDGNHLVFKTVPFQGDRAFLFQNTSNGEMYGVLEEGLGISNTQLSVTVNSNPEYYIDFDGEDAHYDISFDYSSDYKSATVTFTTAVIPEGVANYTGDLYLYGAATNNEFGSEEFKLTCVEPGVYEWRGDMLGSGFIINGGQAQTVYFPDTNMPIYLGAIRYDENANNGIEYIPDSKILLQFSGYQINFSNQSYVLNNAVVRVNLKDLTITLNGELGRPQIDLKTVSLYTLPDYNSYGGEVTDGEILYRNIDFTNVESFAFRTGSIIYGIDYDGDTEIDSENLEATLIPSDLASVRTFPVKLTGKYDVYAKFNENQTEMSIRLESSKGESSGVTDLNGDELFTLTTDINGISVKNVKAGTKVAVYSADGRQVALCESSGADININLETEGIYIVRIAEKSIKIRF